VPRARGIIALAEHRAWRQPRPKLCAQPRRCLRNAPQAEDCPVRVRIKIVTHSECLPQILLRLPLEAAQDRVLDLSQSPPPPERQCESLRLEMPSSPEQATNQATVRPTAP
jgi:hypothetical protein